MTHKISIRELIERPIIRDDSWLEYLNKMTDIEISEFEKEIETILENEGVEKKFPDWNQSYLSKIVDRDILYNTFNLLPMKIFIICPVRLADDATRKKLEEYTANLEKQGHKVHLPHRDTNQAGTGTEICTENMNAIKDADEVHIFYLSNSTGIHFDMGVAFAFNKKIIVVENGEMIAGKSFPRLLDEWENRGYSHL
ncbi:MAG: nucleoside 2-deoxyribosyltransferase [bacterium]